MTELRRDFLQRLAAVTGSVVVAPIATACGGASSTGTPNTEPPGAVGAAPPPEAPSDVPRVRPDGWNPIVYNRERGNRGAIPSTYLPSINGPDGVENHLGKHLPYVPVVDPKLVPAGYVAIMWGDPKKGYAAHPNAVPNESNQNEGHWYNWVRVRKATDDDAEERESVFTAWPIANAADTGRYASATGDVAGNSGKDTIYLVSLPSDVKPGDTLRIHGHCLTHGEYVDFVTV